MGLRGKRPLDAGELKLRGTYRKDRHAKRELIPVAGGVPEKPSTLKGEAAKHWDEIVPQLVKLNIAKLIDTSAVIRACELWADRKAARKRHLDDPTDKDSRIAYLNFDNAYAMAASKLGLTPLDRSRIEVEKPKEEKADPFEAFVRKRG